jgi:hypothetical protein
MKSDDDIVYSGGSLLELQRNTLIPFSELKVSPMYKGTW